MSADRGVQSLTEYECEDCGNEIMRTSERGVISDECPNCFENVWNSTLSTFRKLPSGTENDSNA